MFFEEIIWLDYIVDKLAWKHHMTIQEASDFWDEHSLIEFDGTEEVAVKFNLKKKQYVGIDREVFKKLEAQARRKKLRVDVLLENWIVEKVR